MREQVAISDKLGGYTRGAPRGARAKSAIKFEPHPDVVQQDVYRTGLKELSKFRGTLATNLARWKHKRRGPIAAEFCALIERAGGMGSDLDLFQATERDA